MVFILVIGICGLLLFALGHITGIAHGIEAERKIKRAAIPPREMPIVD